MEDTLVLVYTMVANPSRLDVLRMNKQIKDCLEGLWQVDLNEQLANRQRVTELIDLIQHQLELLRLKSFLFDRLKDVVEEHYAMGEVIK